MAVNLLLIMNPCACKDQFVCSPLLDDLIIAMCDKLSLARPTLLNSHTTVYVTITYLQARASWVGSTLTTDEIHVEVFCIVSVNLKAS